MRYISPPQLESTGHGTPASRAELSRLMREDVVSILRAGDALDERRSPSLPGFFSHASSKLELATQ